MKNIILCLNCGTWMNATGLVIDTNPAAIEFKCSECLNRYSIFQDDLEDETPETPGVNMKKLSEPQIRDMGVVITMPAYDIPKAFRRAIDKYKDNCIDADVDWLYNPRLFLTGTSFVKTRHDEDGWTFTFRVSEA